jgi:tetratricopeptide (TPR) repeat protein
MKRSRGSSSRSPFFIQAVSWLVVLALVSGGLMLILTMLDTSGPLGAISEADISSLSIPRRPPALPVVTPPDKKRNKEESLLAELPVEEAPDVAVERYHEAQDARDEGDLVTAVKILSDIADKYPEFMPPDRISLVEQRLVLEKRIAFTGLMRWAEEVLSAENPDADRLENLLQELSTIPSTDEEFGEVAITLTERANLQLKELENTADGSSEQVPEEHNDVTKDAVENGKVKDDGVAEGSEVVKAEPELSAQDVAAGLLANVKNYYSVGDFIRVKRTVAEYIKKSDSAEVKEVLETALADIEEFGRRYSEGLELVRKPLKNQEAIEELGVALAIDRKVFGTYQHKLKESLAQLHAEVASEYLEDGRYRDARHHLDIAKNFDNGARDVAQLGNLFSYRAAALLRQSRKETDAKAGMRALEQALLLSEKGSSIEKEALNLLQEMTAQKIEESPDSLK